MHLLLTTLVVDDYDQAIAFFVGLMNFELVEDSDLGNGKRWVVVSPGSGGSNLLLARAADTAQRAAVGNQTGGRVSFFLLTNNFASDHTRLLANGICFLEAPRREAYGTVAVFKDCLGNRWDLIQRR